MQADCIFCKIVQSEIPSQRIFENATSLAFLDIYPITEGMTLVIPKTHIANWWEMTGDAYVALMNDTKFVASKLKKHYPDKRIGIQVEGLDVPHVHIKLLPFSTPDEFRAWPDRSKGPDISALDALAKKLTS